MKTVTKLFNWKTFQKMNQLTEDLCLYKKFYCRELSAITSKLCACIFCLYLAQISVESLQDIWSFDSIYICRYLHAFEDFYRKLGSTMGTISRPGRNRHDSGRSILNFRGREKEALAREVIAKEAAKELEKVCTRDNPK